jgi:hypothetical protein
MPELPTIPVRILNFFRNQPDFAALMGDMTEEFHQRTSSSGEKSARRWFRRESMRNAFALTWREFMRTPWRTTFMALACLIDINAVTGVYVLVKGLPNSGALDEVILWLNCLPPLLIGWIGAKILRGREWALALMFSVISIVVNATGLVYLVFVFHSLGWTAPLMALTILGNVFRHLFFWAGCLWARRSDSLHGRVEAANRE